MAYEALKTAGLCLGTSALIGSGACIDYAGAVNKEPGMLIAGTSLILISSLPAIFAIDKIKDEHDGIKGFIREAKEELYLLAHDLAAKYQTGNRAPFI